MIPAIVLRTRDAYLSSSPSRCCAIEASRLNASKKAIRNGWPPACRSASHLHLPNALDES